MQRCEIMLNDLIDSKRTNHNIKATIPPPQIGNVQLSKNFALLGSFWAAITDHYSTHLILC